LDQATPGVANLFTLLDVFAPARHREFADAYQAGTIRYSDLKQVLAEAIVQTFAPVREKYVSLMQRPDELRALLAHGADRAGPVAAATMDEVRARMGLRGST
jgi:tryptophanyl-tRNA synthetase